MSTYNIKSSTLYRLASICNFFENSTSENLKLKINTVRLENKNGQSFAISTNQKIAAIEYLGFTHATDSSIHLKLSPELLQQLFMEATSNYMINIMTIPEIAISTLTSTSGFTLTDCCYWWQDTPLADWRDWACEAPIASKGAMFWNLFHIESLIKSSPSGKIVFPEFIDYEKPITLRDRHNPEWVGLFIAEPPKPDKIRIPAELPEWWNC